MNNSGLAYDLSKFDVEEQERLQEEKKKAHIKLGKKSSVAKSGSILKTIAGVGCAGAVAFTLLYSKVNLSELATQISVQTTALEAAQRENLRLQANLDNMVTLNKVEESAVNDLGLQKTQKSQVKYVTKSTESMAEVAEENDNVFISIQDWFYDILEYLGF